MNVYCMYRGPDVSWSDGYADFDDVSVRVYAPPTVTGGDVVDATSAFGGTDLARTGHYNDCFLASDTDFLTYLDAAASDEYDYLAQETNYSPMGGGTCRANPPRSGCEKALEELELFHYTYLDSEVHPDVLAGWVEGGCMDEIAARLGYRLVLKTGTFNDEAGPGGVVPYSIEIENVGYAAPGKRRPSVFAPRVRLVAPRASFDGRARACARGLT